MCYARAMKRIKESVLDAEFSRWIRRRDMKCLRCGAVEYLQCSHYHTRAARSTRFDPINCITLCLGCHRWLENRKTVEYRDFMHHLFGREAVLDLERRYNKLAAPLSEPEKKRMLETWRNDANPKRPPKRSSSRR